MWNEYTVSDDEYDEFYDYIDGFDYGHNIWVAESHGEYVMVYHNEAEPEGSPYYWGIYTSDGDGDCHGNLDTAKRMALEMMP